MVKPEFFDPIKDIEKIEKLKRDKNPKIIDFLDVQIMELKKIEKQSGELNNVWIYFPWNNVLINALDKEQYRAVRLSRNRGLISQEEQEKFSQQIIGIAGLNVGNPGALCIALEGGAERMKFADNDSLDLSNLNRFRAGLSDLGVNKAVLSAQQVYEIDPFYQIGIFENGITNENIDSFLSNPKIDLLIEEMDNLPLKIKIRERAKHFKIPVLMVTGNGPGLIIDIERFDLDPNLPLLNGYLNEGIKDRIFQISQKTTMEEKINLARDFMGSESLTERLRKSFDLVGKELAGIPQISESSFLRGAVLSYFARQIALKNNIKSGRYILNLDSLVT
jgi:hypothetical protein